MKLLSTDKLANLTNLATIALAVTFVLLPFHAILTVGYAAVVGHYDVLRLWKELVLLALTPVAALLIWRTPGLRRRLTWGRGWLFWCMTAYVVLHIVLGLVALAKGQVNLYALEYAWIINLRPLLIFGIAYVLAARSRWLQDRWPALLLWPASVVIGFGLLQVFLLPTDFLQQFGYNVSTIMPFETVDEKLDYVRIQSTLRGSNPLGAYLVLTLSAIIVLLLINNRSYKRGSKQDQRQIMGITLLSAGLVVLASTYSRSAYAGMLLAGLAAIMLVVHGRRAKQRLAVGLGVLVILAAGALVTLRDNNRFENTFFHTDETSQSATSSNGARVSALGGGVSDVLHEPFGRGPGTAGPASAHNNAPARIAENYYLQIGQEVGWLGLGLFAAIVIGIARRLWALRATPLARVLLASLVGISFINLVQHAWTDDTLALLWWGMAGVALAPPLAHLVTPPAILKPETKIKSSKSNYGQKNKKIR